MNPLMMLVDSHHFYYFPLVICIPISTMHYKIAWTHCNEGHEMKKLITVRFASSIDSSKNL
jgi:aminopeptidase-like protein